jgi:hypothetical protein
VPRGTSGGYCTVHYKYIYLDRASAQKAVRQLHGKGMREFRCDAVIDAWHIGHLPRVVRSGTLTSKEIAPTRRQKRDADRRQHHPVDIVLPRAEDT